MNKVCVKGQRIYFYRRPEPIPKSQVNFSRIEFDMDETWGSFLSVVAQFIQGGEPKNVQVKDGYCFVPPELEVGAFELCLRGDDGESVVASVNRLTLEVCEGFDPSGETPLPPSPDLYTQLVKEIDSGKKIAQSVREDADSGLFNGERGADGGWYTPSVTQTDENTLRMNFTPSKGDMPDVAHTDIMLPNGGGGISDHSKLSNRDAEDQHPMNAITGLVDALAGKQPTGTYLTEETDPTVPDWAKQPEKPSYTADEVGAMSSETLPEAINTALAQAKESGEFDGASGQDGAPGQDGITPTIGDNGNWYLGDTDTGKPSRGETGQAGADGRDGADGQPGADGKSAYQYAVEGGYTGTKEAFAAKLAEEMPDTLPNPNALTFTGAVSGSYDGSAPLEVEIPSGGGGLTITNTATVGQTVKITAVGEDGQPTEWEAVDMAEGGEREWALIEEITLEETASKIEKTLDTPCDELLVVFSNLLSTPNSSIGVGISINGYLAGGTSNGMISGAFVHTSAPAHGIIQIVKAVDYWYGIVSGINSSSNANGLGITRPSRGNGKTKIESFNFWLTTPATNSICAGATLKIYTR